MLMTEILKELPELSVEDLRRINEVTIKVIKLKSAMLALEFDPDDKVAWDSEKYGKKYGTVTSIKGRMINVTMIDGERWKIRPSNLTKIDKFPKSKRP